MEWFTLQVTIIAFAHFNNRYQPGLARMDQMVDQMIGQMMGGQA